MINFAFIPQCYPEYSQKALAYLAEVTRSVMIKLAMKLSLLTSIFALFIVAGCATTPQTHELVANPGDLAFSYEISGVPFIAQAEMQCGPASLAMVAQFNGLAISAEELSGMMFTPVKKGTLSLDILSASRRIGLLAVEIHQLRDLLSEVSAGHPVLVLQNLGSEANPLWHYAVVFGYDVGREELTLHSGKEARQTMDLSQFERTWKKSDHWAVVITMPNELPATPALPEILKAASGLEKAKQYEKASLAYRAIILRWPLTAGAYFGWGYTAATLHHWREAKTAFEKAAALTPDSFAVWNNLIEVYEQLHEKTLARAARKNAEKLKNKTP